MPTIAKRSVAFIRVPMRLLALNDAESCSYEHRIGWLPAARHLTQSPVRPCHLESIDTTFEALAPVPDLFLDESPVPSHCRSPFVRKDASHHGMIPVYQQNHHIMPVHRSKATASSPAQNSASSVMIAPRNVGRPPDSDVHSRAGLGMLRHRSIAYSRLAVPSMAIDRFGSRGR
jgi:hypothetical protein